MARSTSGRLPPARSDLPLPYVISDTMPPTEQVDGRFYTSKSQFRAVGRSAWASIEVRHYEKFQAKGPIDGSAGNEAST